MKKATTKRPAATPATRHADPLEPSAASLRAMPEIDFSKVSVRRNPYASRIAREGAQIVHDEPSRASLAAIPEADFATSHVRRNPYPTLAAGRGRPSRGDEVGPTQVRSLRLPQRLWQALEAEAKARHTTTHALLRELVASFLEGLRSPRP